MYNSADLPLAEQAIYVSFCFVSKLTIDRVLVDSADLTTSNPRGLRGSTRRARLVYNMEPSLAWRVGMRGIYTGTS